MPTVFFDPSVSDDLRRSRLYEGQLFVYSPTRSSLALVEFARELIHLAFEGLDAETAQYRLPVERYAAILAELKPMFIHHPTCKELIQGILRELSFDLDETYFDVPRMRTATSDD